MKSTQKFLRMKRLLATAVANTILCELERRLDPSLRTEALGYGNRLRILPRIVCREGLSFSMQAADGLFSTPSNNQGPWSAVEIGYPSRSVAAFLPFADDASSPTRTFYREVPLAIVAAVIRNHGGLRA